METSASKTHSVVDVSIVIPIYNEEENIVPVIQEILTVMNLLKYSWELIFVDDGSRDKSLSIIVEKIKSYPFLRAIHLIKNAGQSAALDAGFKGAHGKYIITLDGDLQNDPRDIPKMLSIIEKGYDLVTGVRIARQDTFIKRLISKGANFVRRILLDDSAHDSGCSLKIYRRQALQKVRLYKGMHRFLPALFRIEGFLVTEIAVNHRPRKAGRSKYTLFNRGIALCYDLFAVYWMKKRRLTYEIGSEYP